MTEEQQKAIDDCKNQAAREFDHVFFTRKYTDFADASSTAYAHDHPRYNIPHVIDRAMQLHGEQCRKEGFDDGYSAAHADGVIQRER